MLRFTLHQILNARFHCICVISVSCRLKWPTNRLFVQQLVQMNNKEWTRVSLRPSYDVKRRYWPTFESNQRLKLRFWLREKSIRNEKRSATKCVKFPGPKAFKTCGPCAIGTHVTWDDNTMFWCYSIYCSPVITQPILKKIYIIVPQQVALEAEICSVFVLHMCDYMHYFVYCTFL